MVSKEEFVRRVAEKTKVPQKQVKRVLDVSFEEIVESLKQGEKVAFRGFGIFYMAKRSPRKARNPRTGKTIKIPAKLVPQFKAGKLLKKETEKTL